MFITAFFSPRLVWVSAVLAHFEWAPYGYILCCFELSGLFVTGFLLILMQIACVHMICFCWDGPQLRSALHLSWHCLPGEGFGLKVLPRMESLNPRLQLFSTRLDAEAMVPCELRFAP